MITFEQVTKQYRDHTVAVDGLDLDLPDGKTITLADPKSDFAAENVVPLVCKPAMNARIMTRLNTISAKLTTAVLLRMDNAIITQHADYAAVAASFLKAEA